MMRTKSQFPGIYMQYVTEYDVTNISDTRPRKNMITMGKIDTPDLMMIITWAVNISFQSPELKWASWTHTTPYILMTKEIERTSSMLNTPPQDKLYRRLQVVNACEGVGWGRITISSNPDYHPIMQADPCVSSNTPSLGLSGEPGHPFLFIGAGQPLQRGEVRDTNLAWVRPVPCTMLFSRGRQGSSWGVHGPWRRDLTIC